MLHIIYRSYGGENLKNRPDFYSKLVCLYSFIDSVLMIDEEVKLIFMNDGPIPVSYTHLRAHETVLDLVCRLLLEKKKTLMKKHILYHIYT